MADVMDETIDGKSDKAKKILRKIDEKQRTRIIGNLQFDPSSISFLMKQKLIQKMSLIN